MAEHTKRIINNFISLSIVQGLSILFPLITFPYLLRVLGIEGFGVFTIIQTVIMYADLLVSFGFGLSATKAVAKNINNDNQTNNVIITVFLIKMILFLVPLLFFLIASFFIPFLQVHFSFILMASLYVIGNILFPDWYFQGIQKMRSITIVTFISKCISLLLIIFWVKQSDDIGKAILSISIGNFIAGVIGFMLLIKAFSLKIKLAPKRYFYSFFRESGLVFSSIMLVPLYSSVNIFILQYFTNPLIVGYYAISEKIFNAVSMITSVANRTFYPHLTQLYKSSLSAYYVQVKKINLIFFICFSIFAISQFGFAEMILTLLSGKKDLKDIAYAVELLKIMSIAVLFSPYGSFYFQQLIIQGKKKKAMRNIIIVAVINVFSASTLAYFFSGVGMAVNLCIIVFFIGFFNYFSFRKK